jgi:3-oxoacyl-[acyl-carrier protein] reductase
MAEFANRVCVVTGAVRGIGRAIAEALHAEGGQVVGIDRDASLGQAFEADLPGAVFLTADVSDRGQVADAVDKIVGRFGGIDHLVCNAGISRDALVLRLSEDDWNAQLAVNLTGTFHIAQASLRSMLRRDQSSIVAISSVVGETGNAGQAGYAASKAGITAFCRSLAKEVAGRGVRVNVVAPGYVTTDMTSALSPEIRAAFLARIPLGRAADPQEIANVTLFLLSPRASYITGQIIGVNGGLYP